MKILAPLQKNYRFSLGKDMCKKYNLKPGDLLQILETENGILLVPVRVIPKPKPDSPEANLAEFTQKLKEAVSGSSG